MSTVPVNDGLDFWTVWWKEGSHTWQLPAVCRYLTENKDVILAGKANAQVFIPLCGKAHELKWFRDMGHRVVGVEFVEDITREYFRENDLEMEESVCPVINCKILQTPDKTIRIFICDIFDFKRECAGYMDIVWDRSGFTCVLQEDRPRYAALIKSLLADDFSYGLWAVTYDAPWYNRSPRSLDEATIRKLYGDTANITLLGSRTNAIPRFLDGRAAATTYLWHMTPANCSK
ncbi:probable thiopurine S-methyltransferase isoform X1 [Dermacentor silvarum]|uniref:probable thiopurine S-methyltransferase isoform X1 n=1 Tax=Dermacentor silvarum TaxID=543639 RepID=UPI00210174C7|nr:probable thiopurine S-methyltransferase isoform X1 [Dermacentor silvarum]